MAGSARRTDRLSPDSVYSDGVPMSCDDLVLTWAAASGRFTAPDASGAAGNLFSAARRSGYVDIERIDCQTGSKDATVVFRGGRAYADWRALFGANELMPAHVAARVSGVPDVVAAVGGGDGEALRRLADFWNAGWNLTPGAVDLSLLPASVAPPSESTGSLRTTSLRRRRSASGRASSASTGSGRALLSSPSLALAVARTSLSRGSRSRRGRDAWPSAPGPRRARSAASSFAVIGVRAGR